MQPSSTNEPTELFIFFKKNLFFTVFPYHNVLWDTSGESRVASKTDVKKKTNAKADSIELKAESHKDLHGFNREGGATIRNTSSQFDEP